MRTLAIIPARAGSKGIPGKNKRDFCGRPLVMWAIEIGKATCDGVCVSSDDPDILEMAGQHGLARPAELATDETPMLDVVRHALASQAEPPDAVVLLQPTQPLRMEGHVSAALKLLDATCDSVVSVVEIPSHFSPDLAAHISDGWLNVSWTPSRRQDARRAYHRDGTVYATWAGVIESGSLYGLAVRPLIIPESESCTIDTEADWARAGQMWRRQRGV